MSTNELAEKKCPYCAEFIKNDAIICKHCKYNLATGKPPEQPIPNINQTESPVKAKSGIADGVRLGCGMFIVLPILIIIGLIILVAILGA